MNERLTRMEFDLKLIEPVVFGQILTGPRRSILTANSNQTGFDMYCGIQFTNRKRDRRAFEHIFDRLCREAGIE